MAGKPRPRRRWFRWILAVLVVVSVVDLLWLRANWPDWGAIASGPVPRSRFMRDWETAAGKRAQWRPVALADLPEHLLRAIIVAEDSGFWGHDGFDVEAFREAMSENAKRGKMAYGGSTISQQTAKNLFLTSSRTPLRKWHEAVFTWTLERRVSKKRILEIYVNSAELGTGVFGVDAAAQSYWGVPASRLSREQAVELAASLPSPKKHNPGTRTKRFQSRVKKITRHLEQWDTGWKDSAISSSAMAPVTTGSGVSISISSGGGVP